jgi:hypothetical protein
MSKAAMKPVGSALLASKAVNSAPATVPAMGHITRDYKSFITFKNVSEQASVASTKGNGLIP